MARFCFPLQRLLDHRRRIEDEALRDVARLQRERVAIEAELRLRQSQIAQAKQDLRDALAGAQRAPTAGGLVDVTGVRLQTTASLHLTNRASHAVLRLAGVHRRLEAAQRAHMAARARRRAVELLRDKALEEWRRRQRKADQMDMDDIAAGQAARGASLAALEQLEG